MHARREQSFILLGFSFFESQVLGQILAFIIDQYRKKPSELDPETAGSWYSVRGCETSGMSKEETREWLSQMHDHRSSRIEAVEGFIKGLQSENSGEPVELRLTPEEAVELAAVLNDHRLLASARNEIGQNEMDVHTMAEFSALPAPQQTALTEIHFLAYIIESLLHLLSSESDIASGENESLE
ncbi:MAG: hypothetical protein JWM16_1996 [Verrucomicrobiales bacterium]|nr:hypothetical protein [Verrucomicrobiales bacterium]